jgi:hypothetical protein
MGTVKRCFCALAMCLLAAVLSITGEAQGYTHSVGCGSGCSDGHNSTACICKSDMSDCREIECCNYQSIHLGADNIDTSDWGCAGEGVGLHQMCECGHMSSYFTDEWDPYACGTCGSKQWQNCIRDGTLYIQGLTPCHNFVEAGWCRSETTFIQPCTPAGQAGGTLSACQ